MTTHITKEGLDIASWVSVQPEFSAIESPLILRIIGAALARAAELSAQESKPEPPPAWNMLGWANYDEGGFPHFCDIEDEGAFRVYAVNPAPRDSKPELCSDCPPLDYPTDKTRCDSCPRRSKPVAVPQATPRSSDHIMKAWMAVTDRILRYTPDLFKSHITGLECVLAWIDQRAQDASPKDGWQPIETAPKDGTLILIAPVGRNEIGELRSGEAFWYQGRSMRGWRSSGSIVRMNVTHWHPLPEPPQ